MRAPLGQFAQRIVRNDETAEFVRGLLEEGASAGTIKETVNKYETEQANKNILVVRTERGDIRRWLRIE